MIPPVHLALDCNVSPRANQQFALQMCYDPTRMSSPFSLQTPVAELYKYRLARSGQILSQSWPLEIASHLKKDNPANATVEDLLAYLPLRYEDRSNPAQIRDLI